MIPSRMVGHPVEDNTHAVFVADFGEVLEIVDGAELWRNSLIVADAVGGVLAFLDADGVDRHDPHDIDTQIADGVDAGSYCVEGMVGCKHTGVDLIHGDIVDSGQLECLCLSFLGGPACSQQRKDGK